MVFNATFNIISVISWWSFFLSEFVSSEHSFFCQSFVVRTQFFCQSFVVRTQFFCQSFVVRTQFFLSEFVPSEHSFYTPAPRRGRGVYCFTSVRLSVLPSVRPSFRPSKIFFVAFFSVTVDGRNLIFGHKLHICIPYCG